MNPAAPRLMWCCSTTSDKHQSSVRGTARSSVIGVSLDVVLVFAEDWRLMTHDWY
jgi:hypothetical protein